MTNHYRAKISSAPKLFQTTRWKLASWYTGVMGIILSLSGLGVYEAIAHAHLLNMERELKSVSATVHNTLESVLTEPENLELAQVRFLPNACLVNQSCLKRTSNSEYNLPHAIVQDDYYMRLVDLSGKPIALAGEIPEELPDSPVKKAWYTLETQQGKRYRQFSLLLHTKDGRRWGYLQVRRSMEGFDNYLAALRWIMLIGLPITMFLVGIASWWLAKLAMQPIYQSYQQIQQFTADAAHELRTPLAAIRATVESALRVPRLEDWEARETLQVVNRQNQRLSQLVEALLLLSRMDQQGTVTRQNFSISKVSLQDVVSDVSEELAPLACKAGVQLRKDIQVNLVVEVLGNEEQLYRMLANLVTNAINYTPTGGKVEIILTKQGSQGIISVEDNGLGIALGEQEKIFTRFYRSSSDRSRQTGGFGLGLAIAKAIAQAHQGSLKVASELGKGSTFTVYLPLSSRRFSN